MGSCREDLGVTRKSCGTVLFGWWRRFGRSMLRSGRPLSRWPRNLGSGLRRPSTNWVRKAEVDAGTRPGTSSVESAEMRKLRSENRELRRANEILKLASAFFAAELDRPQH